MVRLQFASFRGCAACDWYITGIPTRDSGRGSRGVAIHNTGQPKSLAKSYPQSALVFYESTISCQRAPQKLSRPPIALNISG